jgi:hypothetical protein
MTIFTGPGEIDIASENIHIANIIAILRSSFLFVYNWYYDRQTT